MACETRAVNNKRIHRLSLMVLLAALLTSAAGCHSSDQPAASVAAPPPAASPAQQAASVQDNPNIPPEAKAHITAQIRGQAPPQAAAGTANP